MDRHGRLASSRYRRNAGCTPTHQVDHMETRLRHCVLRPTPSTSRAIRLALSLNATVPLGYWNRLGPPLGLKIGGVRIGDLV